MLSSFSCIIKTDKLERLLAEGFLLLHVCKYQGQQKLIVKIRKSTSSHPKFTMIEQNVVYNEQRLDDHSFSLILQVFHFI